MGKTFKDRRETKDFNKSIRAIKGSKLTPYNRSQERKTKCTN